MIYVELRRNVAAKSVAIMLAVSVFLSNPIGAYARVASERDTLAAASRFQPVVELVPGLREEIIIPTYVLEELPYYTFLKDKFEKLYRSSTIYSRGKGSDPAGDIEFILKEVIGNAFDACIERCADLDINPEDFVGKITLELFQDRDEVVVRVIDNGKTIVLDDKGMPPEKSTKSGSMFFGKKGFGVRMCKDYLAGMGGSLKWCPLKNGTKTEIRIPRKNIPSLLFIKEGEYIAVEKEDEVVLREDGEPNIFLWNKTFGDEWMEQISKELVKTMTKRVAELDGAVTLREAESEIIRIVRGWSDRNKIPGEQKAKLLTKITLEFESAGLPKRTRVSNKEKPVILMRRAMRIIDRMKKAGINIDHKKDIEPFVFDGSISQKRLADAAARKIYALARRRPLVVAVSGPSAVGKTTVIEKVQEQLRDTAAGAGISVSYTTRPPRGKEQDGIDYVFIPEKKFKQMIDEGDFLEWARVNGEYYGTSRREIRKILDRGQIAILNIDVNGAEIARQVFPELVSVFIMPPVNAAGPADLNDPEVLLQERVKELERRIISRGEDTRDQINKRLKIAEREMRRADQYTYVVVNDYFDEAVQAVHKIIQEEARARQNKERTPMLTEENEITRAKVLTRQLISSYGKEKTLSDEDLNGVGTLEGLAEIIREKVISPGSNRVIAKDNVPVNEIEKGTRAMAVHMLLASDGPMDLSGIAVVIKAGLTGPDKKGEFIENILKIEYRKMRQQIVRTVGQGNVVTVATSRALLEESQRLRERGKKVIVLDDGSSRIDFRKNPIEGRAGTDYCLITAERSSKIREDQIQFVDLNAMMLMGVGILNKNEILFRLAYQTFSGNVLVKNNTMFESILKKGEWIISITPRAVPFTGTIDDADMLRRLFNAAA